jgi:hypothetical protein
MVVFSAFHFSWKKIMVKVGYMWSEEIYYPNAMATLPPLWVGPIIVTKVNGLSKNMTPKGLWFIYLKWVPLD